MDFIFTFFILSAIFQQYVKKKKKKKESASKFCDKFYMEISATDSTLNMLK